MSVVATQPAGQERRLMRARDAGCRILRDLDRLGRGRLGVVVRHEVAVLVAGRRAQRPGRVGEVGPATQIDAGAEIGAPARVDAAGQVDRAAKSAGSASGPYGSAAATPSTGAEGRPGGIQSHPHDAAVAPAARHERPAVGRDRQVTDGLARLDRTAERLEGRVPGAAVRAHGPGVLERGVEDLERGMRAHPRRRGIGGHRVAGEAQLTAGEDVVRGAGREDPDARRVAVRARRVAAEPEAHQSTRSWRTMTASRDGPTPITEMRVPLIASRAST